MNAEAWLGCVRSQAAPPYPRRTWRLRIGLRQGSAPDQGTARAHQAQLCKNLRPSCLTGQKNSRLCQDNVAHVAKGRKILNPSPSASASIAGENFSYWALLIAGRRAAYNPISKLAIAVRGQGFAGHACRIAYAEG